MTAAINKASICIHFHTTAGKHWNTTFQRVVCFSTFTYQFEFASIVQIIFQSRFYLEPFSFSWLVLLRMRFYYFDRAKRAFTFILICRYRLFSMDFSIDLLFYLEKWVPLLQLLCALSGWLIQVIKSEWETKVSDFPAFNFMFFSVRKID